MAFWEVSLFRARSWRNIAIAITLVDRLPAGIPHSRSMAYPEPSGPPNSFEEIQGTYHRQQISQNARALR
jgi:hypothetical protein